MDRAPHAIFYPLLGCNARCPFCSSRVYTDNGIVATSDWLANTTARGLGEHTLSLNDAKARYRALRDEGVSHVSLQGGEPTIWPDLFDLIQFGVEIGLAEQILVTNGLRLADATYAARLFHSGVTTIALSIFGATAETHDASLGLVGAFDALVLGVKNLVALGSGGAHVTAQFILHAQNVAELPAMVEFWHAQGIKSFGIRLLQEVPNVAGERGTPWFFDLARLGPLLSRALHLIAGWPAVRLAFPEIFYCLLGSEDIGFVAADLAAGRRLAFASKVIGKRREQSLERRRVLPVVGSTVVCQSCDLESVCAKLEPSYAHLYSGTLRPIAMREEIQTVIEEAKIGNHRPSLDALLKMRQDELDALGIEMESLKPFRSVVDTELRLTLSTLAKEQLEAGTVVQYLSFSSLGARTRIVGEAKQILAELASMANPAGRDKLHFLARRATCLQMTPFWLVFAGRMSVAGGRTSAPFWVILHDDARASETDIAALFQESV